jgi:hypothetical protein
MIPFLKSLRYRKASEKAAHLMSLGYIVFSPISHSHKISKYVTDIDWIKQDLPFMAVCDELWIYCLWGWEKSDGIKREIKEATKLGKGIRYL